MPSLTAWQSSSFAEGPSLPTNGQLQTGVRSRLYARMKSKWLSAILSAFAVIASASSAVAEAPCKYGQIAEVPVTMRGLRPMVSAKLNGVDVQFIVDSGAFYSILSVGAADRLKVPPVPGASLAISGMGGLERASVGRVKEFVFAGLPLNGVQFLILPNDFGVGVGLLGQNVLGIADVEYDLANGVIRLLKPQGDCSKLDLAYWATGRASVIPLQRTEGLSQHTIVSAKVNGREIRALFDTGATTSYLTRGAAQSGGVKLEGAEVAAAGVSGGVGAGLVETTLVPVDSFSIGGETIKTRAYGSRQPTSATRTCSSEPTFSSRIACSCRSRSDVSTSPITGVRSSGWTEPATSRQPRRSPTTLLIPPPGTQTPPTWRGAPAP